MNEPWECPRCKRINAPFNPTCFCKPEVNMNAFERTLRDTKAQQQLPPIPIYPEHGWLCKQGENSGES